MQSKRCLYFSDAIDSDVYATDTLPDQPYPGHLPIPDHLLGIMNMETVEFSETKIPLNCPYTVPKLESRYHFVHTLVWGSALPIEGFGKVSDMWVCTQEGSMSVWVCRQEGSWLCWAGNSGYDDVPQNISSIHPFVTNRYLWFTGSTFMWHVAPTTWASKSQWSGNELVPEKVQQAQGIMSA